MSVFKVKLKRKGICKCGFNVVNDDVEIGRVYLVYPETKAKGFLICGGCGEKQKATLVMVSNYGDPLAPLPVKLFK